MKLTPSQLRFVQEYAKDGNATQAAIRCGISERSAATMGSRWLKLEAVQEALKPIAKAVQEKAEVDASTILRELLNIATFDIADVFEDDGTPKPLSMIPEKARRAIAGMDVEVLRRKGEGDDGPYERSQAHVAKVRMLDKIRAAELLGKHLKLFTDRVQVDANVVVEIVDPYANES